MSDLGSISRQDSTDRLVPRLVPVKTHRDERGCLGVVEAQPDAGFDFKRLYFLYGNDPQAVRGRHAHKNLWQYMLALHGGFDVTLEAGGVQHSFNLSSPEQGLIVPPGFWRELGAFTPGAVCLVAASEEYDESDYIRDYDAFRRWEEGARD